MKTADEYADSAEQLLSEPDQASIERGKGIAILALATATLEAARLMGPTPADQARLDALMLSVEDQYAPYYCAQEWVDEEAKTQGAPSHHPDGKPHRCNHTAGHENAEPHYCRCGSEL